jgi:hypothetical protein
MFLKAYDYVLHVRRFRSLPAVVLFAIKYFESFVLYVEAYRAPLKESGTT